MAPDTVTVLFVDYGNTESVVAAEIWACPAELAAVPPLAIHCSLPLEPQPWSDAAVDKFSALVGVGGAEERTLNMELVKPGDPALVNLYDAEQDVAFAMVGAGFGMVHVEERPVLVPVTTSEREESAPPPVAEPEKTSGGEAAVTTEGSADVQTAAAAAVVSAAETPAAPDADEAVFVAHVNSPLEFYVQSADTGPLDDLMEKLAAAFPAASPVSTVEVGLLAAAPYSEDGAPYRARVLSVADGEARVLFVDYGNSESVAVSELKALDAELAELPPQARPCQLAVEGCEEGAAERLRELAEAEEEAVTVRELAAGVVTRIRLTLSGGDAAGLLTAAGLCRSRTELQLPSPPPPPAEPLRVLVSHIDTPACFFVQRLSELAALDELADQLAELYDATEPPPPPVLAAPCCGDLCVARSAEEEGWHRARVETVSAEGQVRVRLVDFGSSAAATEVREAAPAVLRTPAMALRCRLPARPATDAGWSQEAAAALAELSAAADHKFDARLVSDGGETVVALLCLQGRSVTQTLQERGVEMLEEPLAAESVTTTAEETPAETEAAEQTVSKEMDDLALTEDQGKQEGGSTAEAEPAEAEAEPAEAKTEAAEAEAEPAEAKTELTEAEAEPAEAKTEPAESEAASSEAKTQEPTETTDDESGQSKQYLEESKGESDSEEPTKAEGTSDEKPNDSEEKADEKPDQTKKDDSPVKDSSGSEQKTDAADRSSPRSKDASPSKGDHSPVDGDTPGNGHSSPVNGQKTDHDASEEAPSTARKASAAEEAPAAPEDAQAAA